MKLGLKSKIFIFPAVFVLLILTIAFFVLVTVKDKVLETAHEKLKGDLAMARTLLSEKYPGEWSIRNGKLFKGETQMNENESIVDLIGSATGDTVTIFQGDTRVATNVKDASGKRAVGTQAAHNVVETTLKKGEVYLGKANVVGVWNQTAYSPVKNGSGEIIGMFYVGVPNTQYDQVVKDISTKIIISCLLGLLIVIGLGFFLTDSITRPMKRIIEGLTEGADQVASASSQVSAASQSLAEGASEQASGIEETSSSIEEMSAMTKQNAENAGQANTLMTETTSVVDDANRAMGELTESMKEMTAASEETAKIIKTIDEIAFQTNLLALNAAVEAARAGEAGAGFAVVSDEVRNLALRAADAAKNTANLIEGTVKKIKNGSDIVTRTNDAFSKVAVGAKKVGELVGDISAASQEQSQGVEQINKAIIEMDHVVQKNAASAQESASASEGMNDQAEQMKGYVSELTVLMKGGDGENRSGYGRTSDKEGKGFSRRQKDGGYKALPAAGKKDKGAGMPALKTRKIRPEQEIRMDKADSKEF